MREGDRNSPTLFNVLKKTDKLLLILRTFKKYSAELLKLFVDFDSSRTKRIFVVKKIVFVGFERAVFG